MKKCAIYVRVSTDKDEQKKSLEIQETMFTELLAERGWDLYKIYKDIETGTTSKRPALQQMIQDAKDKKFDIILAKELSRLARNGKLSYQIKHLAEQNEFDIITLDNAIDTTKGQSHMFGLYAWMYEQESQKISERVKHTFRTTALQGKFKGSTPPFGYHIVNRKLYVRDDFTVDIVKRIFQEYISGKGFARIAHELNKEGIPTPGQIIGRRNAGTLWQDSTIRLILTNPHYVGDLVQFRETTISVTTKKRRKINKEDQIVVENTHEPIIAREVFETVQQLIESRKRKRPYAQKHLFTNIAFCACCGRSMHFKANRKGYVCGNYNKHRDIVCTAHFVKEAELTEVLTKDITNLFQRLNQDNFKSILEKQVSKIIKKDKAKLSKIQKELETLKAEKVEALRMKVRKELTDEEYQILIEDNNKRLTELTNEKQSLETSISESSTALNVDVLNNELRKFVAKPAITPDLLNKLIERIEIKEDGSPRIYYRFSNAYISSIFFRATHSTPRALSVETYRRVELLSFDIHHLQGYADREQGLLDYS